MSCQGPREVQQRQMQSRAFGLACLHEVGKVGNWLNKEQLCRKGAGGPGGQVECELTVRSCSKSVQLYTGLSITGRFGRRHWHIKARLVKATKLFRGLQMMRYRRCWEPDLLRSREDNGEGRSCCCLLLPSGENLMVEKVDPDSSHMCTRGNQHKLQMGNSI